MAACQRQGAGAENQRSEADQRYVQLVDCSAIMARLSEKYSVASGTTEAEKAERVSQKERRERDAATFKGLATQALPTTSDTIRESYPFSDPNQAIWVAAKMLVDESALKDKSLDPNIEIARLADRSAACDRLLPAGS
jgi:hypothetical protein